MAFVTTGYARERKKKAKAAFIANARKKGRGIKPKRRGRGPKSSSTYRQIIGKITNSHSVSAGGGRRVGSTYSTMRKPKRNPRLKGRRRSTKPGMRKGITGRTYSGTPMNRAAVTAAVAAAMKKKKNK